MGAERDEVLLLDTSAAVALVLEDHESHAAVVDAVRGRRLGLAGHAWFETFSVLDAAAGSASPLAGGCRDPRSHTTSRRRASLAEEPAAALGAELARLGISGGAVYDALVAAAARQHGLTLVSADVRARSVYEALGVAVRLVA